MTDREKVIEGLEAHGSGKSLWVICGNCPYSNDGESPKNMGKCTHELMHDALELLKEQEAVKPKYNSRTNWYECGACHYSMTSGMHCRNELIPAYKVGFCAKCGKAVNWELTIREIMPNSREDTCKNCPALEVNYNSDESYCNLSDGEEVRLKRGQHRPEWCPKREWKK